MPELPEVETTRLSLLPHLVGRRIVRVELRRTSLRTPIPGDFVARVEGATVTGIRRRAKYLLFDLNSGDVLLAHLGMSGSFRVDSSTGGEGVIPALRKHDHILLYLEDGNRVVYHDPRRFGLVDIMRRSEEKIHKLLKGMGPEPLSEAFSEAYLKNALRARQTPIKPLLMDQKIVVGVGNIYASESLFLAGIHPATSAGEISGQSAAIISSIQKTLRTAIKSGGSTLRNFAQADGKSGYFQHQFNVYNREQLPCVVCSYPIQKIVQAGRATYFCSQCQKQSSCQSARVKK